jgi:hypothetical protein
MFSYGSEYAATGTRSVVVNAEGQEFTTGGGLERVNGNLLSHFAKSSSAGVSFLLTIESTMTDPVV